MQNTSDLYRQILASDNHWFETKVRVNGVDYGEDRLFSVSTQDSMFSGNPEVGKAISGEIYLSLLAPSSDIPTMAKIEPFVRICWRVRTPSLTAGILDFGQGASLGSDIITLSDPYSIENNIISADASYTDVASEWIPKGVFYIDTRESTQNGGGISVLNIHGYDAMLFAEQLYPETSLDFPAVDVDVVNEIAYAMGVLVDPRNATLMTSGYTIPFPSGYTMREILGFIASMYVGSFIISDEGKLRLVSLLELPTETNYLIDNAGDAITFGGDRILV